MKDQKKNIVVPLPDLGKVPPQAIDIEEAVLAGLLVDRDAILTVIDILKPESFYKSTHQIVYQSIIDLTKKGTPADLFLVTQDLMSKKEIEIVGGVVWLTQLTTKVVSAANIEYHARIIAQKYIQREFIRISSTMMAMSFDDSNDISELFEYAENELLSLTVVGQKKEAVQIGVYVDRVIELVRKIKNKEIKFVGKPSGFVEIDRKTGGLKDSELIIVAARPSIGKSAVALQIAENAATMGYPIGIFSLEMSGESLAQRIISGASGKTNVEIMEGRCDIDELYNNTERISKLPIYIDETASVVMIELRAKIRRLIMQKGIKLVIVDYLQLMTGDGQSREQEVSSISRGLKLIAKDLNIPIIALSQLSRKCEERADKRPMLSDLRDSGAIEQDADVVWFLYRPAYYGAKSVIIGSDEVDSTGIMEVIIAKNRMGMTGSFFLRHNQSLTRIEDYESSRNQEFNEPAF
jgi:replicative DNA helicase